MRELKKRTIFALHVSLLLLFALSACQPGGQAATATPATTASTGAVGATPTVTPTPEVQDIAVDTAKLADVQVRILHPLTGEAGQMLTQMIDQFNQTNAYGIFVIEVAPGSTGLVEDKLRELMLNNLTPEIIVASPSRLMRYEVLNGNMLDLTPYVDSAKFGLSAAEQQDFNAIFWQESLYGGKRYGIPAQRTSEMLFYNISWGRELGYSAAPSTWEEFRQQSCAANAAMRKDTDATNDSLGGWIINTNALTTLSWLAAFGSDPTARDAIQFSSPDSEEAFTELLKLENDNCAWVSRLPEPYDYFTNRQALFYSGSMSDLLMQAKNNTRLQSEDEWAVIGYPTESDSPFIFTEGLDYGLTKASEEKQLAAWLFIKWLSAPEQQAWLLRRSGTLPLGQKAQALVPDFTEEHPKWQAGVNLLALARSLPATPELDIAKMVLEDAGWALYKTGLKPEGIAALLTQMDDTIAELAAYRP